LPFIPKFPPGCAHLDLKEVERVLVRHRANISEAAKELGVSRTDLRKLIWHKPKLLEEALLWCGVYVSRCDGLLIQALDSKSRRRREWAVDKILSSSKGYGYLLSPAPPANLLFRVASEQEAAAELEREAAAELDRGRDAELESDRRWERESEERRGQESAERKTTETVVAWRLPAASVSPVSRIRRPSRGGWR
jgi:hypothetical protein